MPEMDEICDKFPSYDQDFQTEYELGLSLQRNHNYILTV